MSDKIRLLCWVRGDGSDQVFSVRIGLDEAVVELKEAIYKKKRPLQTVDANLLNLWKVSVWLASIKGKFWHLIDVDQGEKLTSDMKISRIWNEQPPDNVVSVMLPHPPADPTRRRTNVQPMINDYRCPRSNKVRRLFNSLVRERLVLVRGTPKSGKTTLMELLHAYILKRDPAAFVYVWPDGPLTTSQSTQALHALLKELDPAFPNPSALTFILFDDAEDSYVDELLWNNFFKEVRDGLYDNYRVILFCCYGSPWPSTECPIATAPVLRDAAWVSLRHTKTSIGLFLDRSEFDDVVARYEDLIYLDPVILDNIFNWTMGHVGALVQFLRLISTQEVSRMRRGFQYSAEKFYAQNPLYLLTLSMRAGVFSRSLPWDTEPAEPSIVALFRTLIRDGKVVEDENNRWALNECYQGGWIYPDKTGSSSVVYYSFPTSLHSATLSWALPPSENMPYYSSILELCFTVISHFKPSQMHTPICRVDDGSAASAVGQLPQAQYRDEFYRSLFTATSGSVCISPQFACSKGTRFPCCIDFFIPIVKWGIEVIQDSDRLEEYHAKFTYLGGYRAWLESNDFTDYVLLNFGTSIPQKEHPEIPSLYHVVFSNRSQELEVTMYDNKVNKVGGTITLLESH